MVQDYFIREVVEAQRKGLERQAALQTKADAESYVADVRNKSMIASALARADAAQPRTTGVVERDHVPDRENNL